MGKPVIATAWGGPLDYLDSSCGVLISPTSHEAIVKCLAESMVEMAQADATRQRLGECGLLKVRKEFDWELKVDRMITLYRDAIQRQDNLAQPPT